LTIGELAAAVGLNTSAIRYYERIGVLPAAERVSGRRRYPPEAIRRLQLLEDAKQAGFSLDEARVLLEEDRDGGSPSEALRALADRKLGEVEALIAADRLKPAFLFDRCRVKRLGDADLLGDRGLAAADPELASLLNLNEPADYAAARARPAPAVLIERFGVLRPPGARAPLAARAATLAMAASAAGLELNGHVVAALNGDRISRDPEAPLAEGDRVLFMSADSGG
jgi:DNA-binding transcriptional MerR regulator